MTPGTSRPATSMRVTAHGTFMFLVLSASALLACTWPNGDIPSTARWLQTPALCLQTAALFYLASTALVQWRLVKALQSAQDPRLLANLPTLLGDLWVLFVAAASAWRGPVSRAYLAGLSWQLATLIAVSLLSLILAGLTLHRAKDQPFSTEHDPPNVDSYLRWGGWCHAALSLLVVFALWYLETRPLHLTR